MFLELLENGKKIQYAKNSRALWPGTLCIQPDAKWWMLPDVGLTIMIADLL